MMVNVVQSIYIQRRYHVLLYNCSTVQQNPKSRANQCFFVRLIRGNNLHHSMDVANTKYDAIFDLQGKFFPCSS